LKFLEKLEDAINEKLESLFEKLKAFTPNFVFHGLDFLKHSPTHLKHLISFIVPKVRILSLKTVGYFQHYITIIRGQFTQFLIYTRTEEFKTDKKKALITNPINYVKHNPLKVSTILGIFAFCTFSLIQISTNVNKIVAGTKSSRSIASKSKPEMIEANEKNIFVIKNHKMEVVVGGASAGGHGGGGGEHHKEEIISVDIKIKTHNEHEIETLEEMEEMLDDYLESMEVRVSNLPVDETEKKHIAEEMVVVLNEGLKTFTSSVPIVEIELEFHQHSRADFYRQDERMYALKNCDLQLFLEDIKRNKQVYIDFTVLASNRNIVLFLKDHEFLIRDKLSTNVEPILPHLPIEDEGRRIIKDKVRDELNDILKKEKIEGKIQDVYLDFVLSS
jgi:flagellar basal body-associated protein FliL